MSTTSQESPPLLELPYSERQKIVVVDDAAAQSEGQAARAELLTVGKAALRALVPGLAYVDLFRALSRLREEGVPVLQVGRSESSLLDFPPGHPRDKVVYIGHPTEPTVYCPVADFHRVTFEHKFSEAIDLLIHLGAKEIRVEHVRGWSREFAASLSVPLSHIGGSASIDAGGKQQSDTQLLFEAKLPGEVKPALPDRLWWYPHEPTWQSIANGRLRFGLQNFSLTVSYDDDFGVNAGLKVSTQKVGLDVGSNFEDHVATTWKIIGEFGTHLQDGS